MRALLVTGFLAVLLSGCASTRIFPRNDGSAVISASSSMESSALDAALDDATEYCQTRGRQFAMVNKSVRYQGMDREAKAAINVVGVILNRGAETYGATHSHDDYQVDVTFQCI